MAILWTGRQHDSNVIVSRDRDYQSILKASGIAAKAVERGDLRQLARAVKGSYEAQRTEGMPSLPAMRGALAAKYCGSGWGGYALYLFDEPHARNVAADRESDLSPVEPYLRRY